MRDRERPTRVVVATRLYPPDAAAAAFRMESLTRALHAQGAAVTVLTTHPAARARPARDRAGISVRRWPVVRDRSGNVRGYASYLSFDIPAFARLLLTRSDVVVAEAPPTTGLVALIAARLTGRAFVYYPGDVWTDALDSTGAPRFVVRTMRWIESTVVRGADSVLAVSPEVADLLAAVTGRRIRVTEIGNGIDTELFALDVTPPDQGKPYFVYTGTMSEWQRPEIFVEALALLADTEVELRFFGQGVSEAAIRTAAERLVPGRVHLGGLVPPSEAARWLRGAVAALVSIVPGIGYDFARPTKTYAAAAVGTPVLFAGAQTGGDLVTGAGLGLSADFTPQDVARAMEEMLASAASGESETLRVERAEWVIANASLAAVGQLGASVVLGLSGA